nr:asparagine synthase-related protein [uncultured Draconibacterium sp.]
MASFYFYRRFDKISVNSGEINDIIIANDVNSNSWHHSEQLEDISTGIENVSYSQLSALKKGFTIRGAKGSYWLVGDIRIDNQKELSKLLNYESENVCDLIVNAYESYGNSFAEHLIGDFGFVLHDLNSKGTVVVRDHLGVIPVYYYLCDQFLLVSDSIDIILSYPSVPHTLNDTVVLNYLKSSTNHNQQETFYADIYKIPRATVATFNDGVLESETYWHPELIEPIKYETEEEYVSQLANLLEQAVADRLPPGINIGAHLSGGLDSSPVALMAGRKVIDSGRDFFTYNWCRPEPEDDKFYHEWADARKIASKEGFVHSEINYSVDEAKKIIEEHDVSRHGCTMIDYERITLPIAQQQGVQLIFSGFGGDELLTMRSRSNHIDLIKNGRWIQAFKNLIDQDKTNDSLKLLRVAKNFGKTLFYSFLPDKLLPCSWSTVKKIKLKAYNKLVGKKYSDFLQYEDIRKNTPSPNSSIRDRQLFYLNLGYHQDRMESWNILGKMHGVKYVYPLLDKRVVEFALSMPENLFYKQGISRYLYRKAVTPYLPKELLYKQKPPETYRVKHLLNTQMQALKEIDLDKINSPYLNKEAIKAEYSNLKIAFEGEVVLKKLSITNIFNALHINKLDLKKTETT